MADTNALHCGDMLFFFNSLVCTTVKEIEGVNQSSISLSSLKLNKKRASGDLILPGFVRACCVSDQQSSRENGHFQRLCQEITSRLSRLQFFENCCVTSSVGHLLLKLNRSLVSGTVIYNVLNKVDFTFTESPEKQKLTFLLNPSLLWSLNSKEQENLSLDQLRTALVTEHSKELLQVTGMPVKLIPFECQANIHPDLQASKLQLCHIFVPSCMSRKGDAMVPDIEIVRKVEELVNILQSLKFSKQVESIRSSTEPASHSCNNEVEVGKYNCDSMRYECSTRNFVCDIKDFHSDMQKHSVSLSCSLLKEVAKLELVGKSTASADILLHITSCRRAFTQQQVSAVWQRVSESSLANKQFLVTHGLVTVNNSGEKLQVPFGTMDLLKVREKQLMESYVLKYGNKVEGHAWESSIHQMAVAAVKLEILSIAPNSEVKIDVSESSREFRQATFVMYNCARLAKLFENFEKNVLKGIYPALPPIQEVDFSLLRDEDEWELILNFIVTFPSVIKSTVPKITLKSHNVIIQTNKICSFLFTLSHKFSSYYGRVHILGESRHHLFPTMFARLYLMKALQQIILTCLKLLNISSLKQM
ncbi:unnamed protein product [Porites evermanni]|uniref:DALR anticodon binding domain-containing protein n=1 Tax=Porites evermanni TaxID=104178 RepID=A0ABN8Q544_9CNID|nr:unnamed protein product [Porites evermanni]